MNCYKVLNKQVYSQGDFSIVPIRYEDRFEIMKWRNEQIYHLRQDKPLTIEDQDKYFSEVVARLFELEKPNQILFSFLKNEVCIGYGGLVHINWIDLNAEISFVIDTQSQKDNFKKYWSIYLKMIEDVAFNELNFHKIYTYAFDLRPHLYEVIEKEGYHKEAVLKNHCFFNGKFIDVVIHSKFKNVHVPTLDDNFFLREAMYNDAELLFNWANDIFVRKNALNQELIIWENHLKWLKNKIESLETKIFILTQGNKSLGQIRIDKIDDCWQIDYSIDCNYRGQGLGTKIVGFLLENIDNVKFKAIVKKDNKASYSVFVKLGFKQLPTNDPDLLFFEYQKLA
ncbi:GNAT family N-acetyltransferase [Flavobacterium sp. KBS0721]|uniref:GNAT family N-acetyltransferase n=1 Tax=Flavobacterium sp. KBS0721 TaxID=1179672 RepID=UPI00098FBBBC|nr:GNAT family N-acetyltransferase [Flavobacterium sp. KBS0721]QDW18882.1 GNAT family N-acetyltransferase [Flavobacterium sp. KBS0721]